MCATPFTTRERMSLKKVAAIDPAAMSGGEFKHCQLRLFAR